MNQNKLFDAERAQRRYSALSLPLRESMLAALQHHQDDAVVNQLAFMQREHATNNAFRGAWHE